MELVSRYIDAQSGQNPFYTCIEGLTICTPASLAGLIISCTSLLSASPCKERTATFGDQCHRYSAGQALLVSVEMPGFGTVAEARPTEPYLGVILELDLAILRSVAGELPSLPEPSHQLSSGVFVTDFNGQLTDCTARLLRLLYTLDAIPFLFPAIMCEISYWLLTGPHGREVTRVTLTNNHERSHPPKHPLSQRSLAEPVRIATLASSAQLSPSAFHRQFRAITSITPLHTRSSFVFRKHAAS